MRKNCSLIIEKFFKLYHLKIKIYLSLVHSTVTGSQHVPMYYSFPSRHADGYALELDHFLDIVGGAEPSVTGRMTLAISKIASSCEESARSGQPVKLTWEEHELPQGYQGK